MTCRKFSSIFEDDGSDSNIPKSNLTASTAPTVNDDATLGYDEGSLWWDSSTSTLYVLDDATTGAAIWTAATGGGGGGSGDVVGPASATANAVALFNGTSGKLLKNSGVTVDGSGNLTANNVSGTNTGDQTITLTGDVTGTGTGSFATAIGNNKVTLAMLAQMATNSFLGRISASTGNVEVLSAANAKTILGLTGTNSGDVTLAGENYLSLSGQQITAAAVNLSGSNATGTLAAGRFPALTGDVTTSAGSLATTIANSVVTYAKMQDVSATDKILGRSSSGAGVVEEIACTSAGRALIDDADAAAQRATLGLVIGTNVQAYDAELAALAGLTSAADKLPYFTGSGTAGLADFTSFGRSLVDDADASAARTTLGLVIGTNVQAFDAELAAIAGLTSAADKLPYFTGSGTAGLADFTSFGRSLVDDADASAARTTLGLVIGTNVQAQNARLQDIASNLSATSGTVEKTGADTFGVYTVTAAGKALIDDADDAAQRTTLGLGTLATQNGTFSGTSSGTNTGDQNIFQTIAVSGQSSVVADSTTDTLTLVAGTNITITTNATSDTITIAASGGGSISDGDYGDITVSSGATVWTIDNSAVTYAKMQDISATDKILGRSSSGAGVVQEIACTAAGRAILDDVDAAAQRVTLGAAASGANTDITSVYLDNTGLKIKDTNASHGLIIAPGSNITADRTLTITTGDASRVLTMAGDATISGTNTGDQTITLSGDVTGSGTGSFAATIGANKVTAAKMSASATDVLFGRSTAGAGGGEEIPCTAAGRALLDDADAAAQRTTLGLVIGTNVQAYDANLTTWAGKTAPSGTVVGTSDSQSLTNKKLGSLTSNGFVKTSGGDGTLSVDTNTYLTGNQTITLGGDLSGSGTTSITATIANDAVTYAKMQNISATARVLGRKTSGAGDTEECTLSDVLDFVGSAAQGDILYRDASGWTRLGAGTNGQFLKTQGAGANPVWATGGSGSPGGSSGQLQYNNAGSFGGITGVTSDGDTLLEKTTFIDDTDSPYTVLDDDINIYVDSTSGDVDVDLPDATMFAGRTIFIKKLVAGNDVVIAGTEDIDGDPSVTLSGAYSTLFIKSDGVQWEKVIVSGGGSGTPAGSDTQVQYNDSGAFGAAASFTFNKSVSAPTINLISNSGNDYSEYLLTSQTPYTAGLKLTGASYSGGVIGANSLGLLTDCAGGIYIGSAYNGASIYMATNGVVHVELTNEGQFTITRDATFGSTTDHLFLRGFTDTTKAMRIGLDIGMTTYGYIDAYNTSSGAYSLIMQPSGGYVMIGTGGNPTQPVHIAQNYNGSTVVCLIENVATGGGSQAATGYKVGGYSNYFYAGNYDGVYKIFSDSTLCETLDSGGNLGIAGALTVPGTFTWNSQTYTGPSSHGMNGYVLTEDGSGNLTWGAVTATPAGSSGDIQTNNGSGGLSALGAGTGYLFNNGANSFVWESAQPTYGGTGQNTSGSTGVPYITSGTWSVDSTYLQADHGGTGMDTYQGGTGVGVPTVSSGAWTLSSQLSSALGGTAIDTGSATGTPTISSGTWSVVSPVADATYTVGIGVTTNGTITTQGGIVTAVQEAT